MSILLDNPDQEIKKISQFILATIQKAHKKQVVVAVSGGIDSALSLSLAVKALGADQVYPVFLPYGEQNMADARQLAEWLKIPATNWREVNILPVVTALQKQLGWQENQAEAKIRLGNIMARVRMTVLYDLARQLDALVGGTENLSEHYLGYFTRFGDEASDFEPIRHLFKTQVRQLVEHLGLPEVFLTKAPSAGLWPDQTDEQELGFSYEVADQVLAEMVLGGKSEPELVAQSGLQPQTIKAILKHVQRVQFKHEVPYRLE